jgi:hypothetical protein
MGTVENGIGQLVRRRVNWRVLTGRGCYVDDLAAGTSALCPLLGLFRTTNGRCEHFAI